MWTPFYWLQELCWGLVEFIVWTKHRKDGRKFDNLPDGNARKEFFRFIFGGVGRFDISEHANLKVSLWV